MNKNNKKKDPVKITRNSQLEQQLKIKLSKIANNFQGIKIKTLDENSTMQHLKSTWASQP
jgi:hypothetical protein